MALRPTALLALLRRSRPYSLYVLLVLMVVYLFNQLDRFVLGVASTSLAEDLQFAHQSCFPNISASIPYNISCVRACTDIKNQSLCDSRGPIPCVWEYTATGIRYEVLAGPAFTFMFTLVAIPLGVLAGYPWVNRKLGIAVCLGLWSLMTLFTGFTHKYWQVLLTRIGLGVFEAVCTPFASSIISDHFEENFRGTALGFYNWGIYIGYSLAFAFNFIVLAVGWRWTFRIAAFPGFVLSVIMVLTVQEPERRKDTRWSHVKGSSLLKRVLNTYLQPGLLLLCVGGGLRQGGGLVWAYNVKAYFKQYYCGRVNVGDYLSWVPLVGGTLGALVGGFISDRLARSKGFNSRLWVLITSQLLASPFLVGALLLPPTPWAFLSLLPAYIIGEMWIGVCLAMVISMVPPDTTSAAVALFLFIINNIGSSMTLLLPSLEDSVGLRYTLLLLFPGLYVAAAGFFALTLLVLKCSPNCRWQGNETGGAGPEEDRPLIQNIDTDSVDSVIINSKDGWGYSSPLYSSPLGSPIGSPVGSDKED